MVEISDVVVCGPESACFMDHELGIVVHRSLVDRHAEIVEESDFVATHHRSEVAHRGETGLRRLPERFFHTALSTAGTPVIL